MANSLASAGATVEPSEYAALAQDEHFTGLWTQRNPLRDADVPWIYRKYYGAGRYDSILDGINREITARLTDARRPGSSLYNSASLPSINRFYPFKTFSNGQESIRVLADCAGTNALLNPDFSQGSTGWDLEGDPGGGGSWSVTPGGLPNGTVGNLALYTGTGTAAVSNQKHIACTPGTVISASCWGLGEPGALGTAVLRIIFYNAGGSSTGVINGTVVPAPATYVWTKCAASGAAPAGTTYAVVDFAVEGKTTTTGRWAAWNFTGGYAPVVPTVRDVTGPSTNAILWKKDPSAGRTSFLAVGNVLYAGDGVNTHQYITSSKIWVANTQFQPGDYIIDPNGNIQMAVGSVTANIAFIQIDDIGGGNRKVTWWTSPSTPFDVPANIQVTSSGQTYVPSANMTTAHNLVVYSVFECSTSGASSLPVTAYHAETGTLTTGSGVTSGTQPSWNATIGQATQDGGNQWVNMGPNSLGMGVSAPTIAPTVTLGSAPSIYNALAPSTWYAPAAFIIKDGNGNLEQATQGGTTASGPGEPSWQPIGSVTTDGTVKWRNLGSGAWQAGHAYNLGDCIQASYSYTTTSNQYKPDGHGGFILVPVVNTITVTSVFTCTLAGVSGAAPPFWNSGVGTVTREPSGLTWSNVGSGPGYPGNTQKISLDTTVVDSLGYLQKPTVLGETGSAPPTGGYATQAGGTTPDGNQIWLNAGAYSIARTQPWQWAYSGKNSITGEISNPSPISIPLVPGPGQTPIIQGPGLAGYDTIVLWRTAAGGSTLLYEDEFANPAVGATWIYTDTNPDSALNTEMPAPGATGGATLATAPPSTAVAPEYHCGRVWMINGNYVIYSGGPDTVTGNGMTAFPPNNYFLLPEQPIRLKSITMYGGGLIVFCLANTYVILGDGTGAPAFQPPRMYLENVGLMSYDAICMVGSTFYGMSNKSKVFSIDPGSGYLEIGFPVGDQFKRVTTGDIDAALYNPVTAYVTWHEKDSTDTGLYVADSAVGWFRWSAIAPPESGSLWHPRAAIVGGTSCVQSVEVTPGIFELLIGPNGAGPILKRDPAQYGDWVATAGAYQGYPGWDTKGSIGLCETGEVAEVAHIALKSMAMGARPAVSILLDEIKAGVTVEGRTTAWDVLNLDDGHHEDPPNLEPSITMYSDRYQTSSTAECPKCESFLLRVDYGTQQQPDELLKFAVYGAVFKEKRQS